MKDDWYEDNKHKVKEFFTIQIEHCLMKYPDAIHIHECPKCHTRYPFQTQNMMAVDEIVNLIMSLGDKAETFRWALIEEVINKVESK